MIPGNTVFDLRFLNSSTNRKKIDFFWEYCSKYLNESIGIAADDRRHSDVAHLAQAISIRDLRDEVQKQCPDGTWVKDKIALFTYAFLGVILHTPT